MQTPVRSAARQTRFTMHAGQEKASLSPAYRPTGKFLMFTLSAYGNFSIWHKDADLYLAHLHTNQIRPLSALNSNDVESYHSWSSNSHWVVFSSRRTDGLYTRPFIAYIDEEGKAHKPFLAAAKGERPLHLPDEIL